MSGPPAMDIGMYSCAHGVRSPSVIVDVLETTPTILNHSGAGVVDGSVIDMRRWSIGSLPGKKASASALLTTTTRSCRSTSCRSMLRPLSSRMPIASM
jgi:hypothetical protein